MLVLAAGCGSEDATGERTRCQLTVEGGTVWIDFSGGQVLVTHQEEGSPERIDLADFPTFDGVYLTISLARSESILFVGPPGAATVELDAPDGRREMAMGPCGPTSAAYTTVPAGDGQGEATVRDAGGATLTEHELVLGRESGVLGGKVGGPPPTG